MNRNYLTQQLDDAWWAAVVADPLYPVQVGDYRSCSALFTSHERGQVDQIPWAVGRVAAALGSAKGADRDPGRWIDWPPPRARPEMGMSKEAVPGRLP